MKALSSRAAARELGCSTASAWRLVRTDTAGALDAQGASRAAEQALSDIERMPDHTKYNLTFRLASHWTTPSDGPLEVQAPECDGGLALQRSLGRSQGLVDLVIVTSDF